MSVIVHRMTSHENSTAGSKRGIFGSEVVMPIDRRGVKAGRRRLPGAGSGQTLLYGAELGILVVLLEHVLAEGLDGLHTVLT